MVLSFLLAGVDTFIAWQVGQRETGVKCACKEPVFETRLVEKAVHCPCKWAAPGNKTTSLCAVAFSYLASCFPSVFTYSCLEKSNRIQLRINLPRSLPV